MSELRWHPLLEEWVITATHRQDRTFLPPADYCPLCPTLPGAFPTEVPRPSYDLVVFDNKFPSLSTPPPSPTVDPGGIYLARPAEGACEVICYTSRHDATLTDLPLEQFRKLVSVWAHRYAELSSRPDINYVLIFENKGKDIGVTLYHPHGQLYAFPFVPPKPAKELQASLSHFNRTGHCLLCDVLRQELTENSRVVVENDSFVVVVPFFARYPYETYVIPRRHHQNMLSLDGEEQYDLAEILKLILLKYDALWGTSLPYMMIMHQSPTDGMDYPHYHFHIEFHPPNRTKEKLKYIAGCETGAWTYINDTLAEEKAAELRAAAPNTEQCTFLTLDE